MNVEIKDKKLIITLDLEETYEESASKKSLIVATSHGIVKTSQLVNGKPLSVVVNAFILKDK